MPYPTKPKGGWQRPRQVVVTKSTAQLWEEHKISASLDLEATFKQIKISRDIVTQVCNECNAEFCRCPAFTPGTPCTSASSTPTSTSDEQIPELVADKSLQQLQLPLKTSSDEEADREVEAICAPTLEYDRQCPTITIAESSLSLRIYN